MRLSNEQLKEFLVDPGYISEKDWQEAVTDAKERKAKIEDVVLDKNLISEDNYGEVIAQAFGYSYISIKKQVVDEKAMRLIPELVAKKQGIFAFGFEEQGLQVAMADPSNLDVIQAVTKATGHPVKPYLITARGLDQAHTHYRKGLQEEFKGIIDQHIEDLKKPSAQDVPIIRIINTLLEYAYENNASDVHIEPRTDAVAVRFRIDGVLHKVIELPKNILDLLVMRIKILSKMRTDEHMAALDGKFQYTAGKDAIDIRVSIVPVSDGEKVVMRLLSSRARQYSLEDIGFSGDDLTKMQKAIKKPHGMIIVTGPTGSGKTTTLYSVLKILSSPEVNVSTIEDPVEYDMEGVNQIQVNTKTNLTFSAGLRAIVRQDPDIIMVGEIRDQETADIAVNSAMTGHLVLSTLHANDAATTIPRFLEMEIEPFLLASTIHIIVAQRLVRSICMNCRESFTVEGKELKDMYKTYGIEELVQKKGIDAKKLYLFKGKGCGICNNTGYAGRIGIFEVIEMTDAVRKLIVEKADAAVIKNAAIAEGMKTMFEDGFEKVQQGLTTLEEVARVTKE